jgi:hypothetical protein
MEIIKKEIPVVGGKQEQFIGLQVGRFTLVPDSDTGTRPDNLRVTTPNGLTLNISGGMSLIVETHAEGLPLQKCLDKLTDLDRAVLRTMAWNLPGRTWPTAGERLKELWERWGEAKIITALEHLFQEVEKANSSFGHKIKAILCPAR